jgi:hypothetical protein
LVVTLVYKHSTPPEGIRVFKINRHGQRGVPEEFFKGQRLLGRIPRAAQLTELQQLHRAHSVRGNGECIHQKRHALIGPPGYLPRRTRTEPRPLVDAPPRPLLDTGRVLGARTVHRHLLNRPDYRREAILLPSRIPGIPRQCGEVDCAVWFGPGGTRRMQTPCAGRAGSRFRLGRARGDVCNLLGLQFVKVTPRELGEIRLRPFCDLGKKTIRKL